MTTRLTGLWRHPDFLKLWSAETISLFGSAITQLALPLTAISQLNATPSEMGFLNAAQFLPFLLFGLLAGAWIDRRHRRPILIAGDLGRAALLLSIPFAAIVHQITIMQLIVVAFLHGILTLFFDVAYQSYLPSLVNRENLVEGNSKLEVSRAISAIGGPGMAGALIKLFTAPITIVLDSLSFLVSALLLWRIRKPEPVPEKREEGRHIGHDIVEGLGVVFGNPMLRSIAGSTGTFNLFNMIGFAVLFLFMSHQLELDEAAIGLIFGLSSIGGLIGAVMSDRIAKRFGVGPAIIGSAFVGGAALLLIPLAPVGAVGILVLTLAQFIAGMSGVIYNINQVSLRQAITPDRLQGRMNASMRFLVWGTMPIGSLIGGFLGEQIGLRNTLWVAGIGTALSFLWVFLSPVRTLFEQPKGTDDPPTETAAVV